jgi:drug/metabolite transporter (DMT)-like permease
MVELNGILPTILGGLLGGVLTQIIQIAGAFKAGRPPKADQWIASAITALLGAGAVLYGDKHQSLLTVASIGAAFPLVFQSLVASAAAKREAQAAEVTTSRTWPDWVSGRR